MCTAATATSERLFQAASIGNGAQHHSLGYRLGLREVGSWFPAHVAELPWDTGWVTGRCRKLCLWQPPALFVALRVGALTVPLKNGLDFVFLPHTENSK